MENRHLIEIRKAKANIAPNLAAYFKARSNEIFDQRDERYKTINTPEKIRQLQKELRTAAREIFGQHTLSLVQSDTPPKTLHSGTLERDGVQIQKFMYEVFPHFWGTALLYKPIRDRGRCPALVMPVGHWWDGKSVGMYQRLMHLFARRGIICVSLDSCGQGERITHFDPVLKDCASYLASIHTEKENNKRPYPLQDAACHGFWQAKNVTSSHCLVADPGYLCGIHQNALTAIAGKRLVDLLISRKDVNPEKIGACGASGGGADTRFLAALDDRIKLAVPTSILNTHRAMTAGDADQSFFFTLSRGISQTDLLICLAPNPLLIISSSADEHDSKGVANYYRPFWKTFGKSDHIAFGTGEGPHGFPLPSRKIITEFVLKHFCGETVSISKTEHSDTIELPAQTELQTTLCGNVYFDRVGLSPLQIIHDRSLLLAKKRKKLSTAGLKKKLIELLMENEENLLQSIPSAKQEKDAIFWKSEGGVPVKIFETKGKKSKPYLLAVHEYGAREFKKSPLHRVLQKRDCTLGLLDFRGVGVSESPGKEYSGACISPMLMGKQAQLARMALHQGRNVLGMRTTDLLQSSRILSSQGKMQKILVAEGGMGLTAILACFLQPNAFEKIYLYRTPVSWHELTSLKARAYNFTYFLFGVLEHFDLPDLTAHFPKGKIVWINPTDASAQVILPSDARKIHSKSKIEFVHARVESELVDAFKR
jgi:hypothetical protein